MDPTPPKTLTKKQAQRVRRAKSQGERLFELMQARSPERPHMDPARILSVALAVLIQLPTIAIAVLGLYVLVSSFPHASGFVIGLPLLFVAALLIPHFGKLDKRDVKLSRREAPVLYGVVDRIAISVGAKPVDLIALDPRFNASHAMIGLRRRRVLWLGLALWNVLDGRERVALLGHELGHQVNGDLSRGVLVGTALRTLASWYQLLWPGRQRRSRSRTFGFVDLAEMSARGFFWLFRVVVGALYRLERQLLYRSGQRAEYLADALSARLAGRESAIGVLDALYLADTGTKALVYAARRSEPDVWEAERRFLRDLPEQERERLRRAQARQGHAVDSSHPPTNLRIQFLRALPLTGDPVVVSEAEWEAIAAEMKPGYDRFDRMLRER
ncbi:MAG TPA: M48 family metallopeptidase [Candidatus Acidoferrales bacterium]|nr:M48 family metallopeptidase [Candidatus Acidoferrales bacterium]